MTPWVVKEGLVSESELAVFRRIKAAIEKLPDGIVEIDELSCHMLARAVKKVFSGHPEVLEVWDGHFYPLYSHSWLTFKSGNVIDVYPVGTVGGPVLVVGHSVKNPAANLYLPKRLAFHNFRNRAFLESVDKIASVLFAGVSSPCAVEKTA